MRRALRLFLVATLLSAAGGARAQGYLGARLGSSTLFGLSWEATVPQGPVRDFVDATSYRGGRVDLAFGVGSRLSLGLTGSFGWVARSQARGELPLAAGTISGPAYARAQLIDGLATATVYLARGTLQPYLGLGAGGGHHDAYRAVATVVRQEGGWHATGAARAGLLLTVRPGLALDLQARYAFTDARLGAARDARWLSVGLGVAAY